MNLEQREIFLSESNVCSKDLNQKSSPLYCARPGVIKRNTFSGEQQKTLKAYCIREKQQSFTKEKEDIESMDTASRALNDVGLCVIDNFLPEAIARKINEETIDLHSTPGVFYEALSFSCKRVFNRYRSDRICWISGREPSCKHLKILIDSLTQTITMLVQQNNLQEQEAIVTHKSHIQVSCNPANSFGYLKHVDNPDKNGRLITAIYYANENYNRDKDGGITRFYVQRKCKYFDVEPKFNRAVIHWSDDRIASRTFTSSRDIFSFTSWFFGISKISYNNKNGIFKQRKRKHMEHGKRIKSERKVSVYARKK